VYELLGFLPDPVHMPHFVNRLNLFKIHFALNSLKDYVVYIIHILRVEYVILCFEYL